MKVSLTPHQQRFIGRKMKGGGYLSEDEVIREALRVYELTEQDDTSPELEAALRHGLRSPKKRYKPGHFAALASQNGRRAIAA
jgi:putative addiction module CopG family antidote